MVVGPIAVLFSSATVAAQPDSLAFTWDAPDGCPAASAVLDEVTRTLAAPGQTSAPIAVAAHVVGRSGQPWGVRLSLDVGGARTQRQFEAETCDAAASAVVLIVTLALEEKAESFPARPQSPTSSEPPRVDRADGPGEARSSRQSRDSWAAMVTALVDGNTAPQSPAYGFELAGRHRWSTGRWRLGALAAASLFPRHRLEQSFPTIGSADFWLLDVSGRGCVGVAFSRFEIGPCLGVDLAAMHVFDSGSDLEFHNSTEYWLSLASSAVLSWNFQGRWSLVLRIEAIVPATQPIFHKEGSYIDLYQVPAFAWRGGLGVERRFE
jgi:hypothetical protein